MTGTFFMRKKVMKLDNKTIKTLDEGFEDFIFYCKRRNLREDSIGHYNRFYHNLINYVDKDIPIEDINKNIVDNFIIQAKERNLSSQTISSYIKDFATILHFFMRNGWLKRFSIEVPKVDIKPKATYTAEEIKALLKKPNLKKCNFTMYQCWVVTSLLASTGLRLTSIINIKIKDIDFDNEVLKVQHTKNRKSLLLSLNKEILKILREYLRYRGSENGDDYLFCNTYGEKPNRETFARNMRNYNRRRGVLTEGSIHKWRHTFATHYLRNGGDITKLQKYLGHTNLLVTERYTHLLMPDLNKDVNENNILKEFNKTRIKMR